MVHNFHIPVMGIGYTIDSALRVAPFGIDSALSLVDDSLVEKMRQHHCLSNKLEYIPITSSSSDFRAKRITAYLDLLHDLVANSFNAVRDSEFTKESLILKYISLLPNDSPIKKLYTEMTLESDEIKIENMQNLIRSKLYVGSIDVNIMTRLDRENYVRGNKLDNEFNDAHAALRGFAKSKGVSSVVLSAGFNRKLYSYLAKIVDFQPDLDGNTRKKIVLKVSDYRSALTQGRLLAKKGVWVSEFRIESGLNCGGHAFPTNGHLLGPILDEFKEKRDELHTSIFSIYQKTLSKKYPTSSFKRPVQHITVQGGVGTSEEHKFLIDHYGVNSIGWGTPFLLVPEIVNVDQKTLDLLKKSGEKECISSKISPLGVLFNTVMGTSKEIVRDEHIKNGRPGFICTHGHLALNHDASEKPICAASRLFQKRMIEELDTQSLSTEAYNQAYSNIVEKSCICVGLGTSALIVNDIKRDKEGDAVSICPGPNIAYFKESISLETMVDHIYGRISNLTHFSRPHMFIKELLMYRDYFLAHKEKSEENLVEFKENIEAGIEYYKKLFATFLNETTTNIDILKSIELQLSLA